MPLGSDGLGRCVLSRIIYGARVSLTAGFVAVAIAMVLGITLGFYLVILVAGLMRYHEDRWILCLLFQLYC